MVFVKDLGAPETPRLLPDESAWLCVEMAGDRGCATWISLDGKEVRRIARTGRPNGLTVDKENVIWVAETYPTPSLVRVTLDGDVSVFSTGPEDEPFLFPNDLCFGPDGALYMTDSGILLDDWAPGGQLRPDWKVAQFDGRIYRIDLDTKEILKLDSGQKFTNGICYGPDDYLYANEMITGNIYRYKLKSGEVVGERETFGNVMDLEWGSEGFRGPDGMNFGADGNLYCAVFGQGDVTVLGKEGEVIKRIKTEGVLPTNVAFGPGSETRLYVTENEFGQIEVFDVDTTSGKLYYG